MLATRINCLSLLKRQFRRTHGSLSTDESHIIYNLQDRQVVEGLTDVGQDHHMEVALVIKSLSLFPLHYKVLFRT